MQRNKKQRQQKELKQSLKTYLQINPHLFSVEKASLISRIYPQIASINSLRIFAVMEILYLLQLTIDLIQKRNANLADFRIGLIGGGVTARLLLNCILPLSKDGLVIKNITLSTRQTQNFNIYSQIFGINILFDNQSTARNSDFLIICTPATLDNWIISDLKEPLQCRISGQVPKPHINSNINKLISEKSQLSNGGSSIQLTQKLGNSLQMSGSLQMPKSSQGFMKPLVYILTSDFTEEKCNRFFSFPVLVPSIRAVNLKEIAQKIQKIKGDSIQAHEKALSWWLTKPQVAQRKIDSRQRPSQFESYESQLQVKINKYYGTPFSKILIALNHVFGSPLNIASLGSSLSITISVNENVKGKKTEETMVQILQVATVSGDVEETFLKKCKKWRMAHNNYIA